MSQTLIDSMTGSLTTNARGICADHIDPDIWFVDFGTTRPSHAKFLEVVGESKQAVAMCNACPIKDECLAEGMEEQNIAYGIWGGLHAGERLMKLGHVRSDFAKQSEKGKAMDLYERLRPYLEVKNV